MGWKDTIIDAFDAFGPGSLAAISFTEAIIQPVPPDLVYLPMLVEHSGDVPMVVWLWAVVTLSSVAGSIVGYWIGRKWGRGLVDRFAGEKNLKRLDNLTIRYGTLGVFIAAFSPIPYKVFGWVAGMGEMNQKKFIIAGLFGRGLRFGLEAVAIGIWGDEAYDAAKAIVDNEFLIGALIITSCIITYLAWRWWQGLANDPETS